MEQGAGATGAALHLGGRERASQSEPKRGLWREIVRNRWLLHLLYGNADASEIPEYEMEMELPSNPFYANQRPRSC